MIDHVLWGFGALFWLGYARLAVAGCPDKRSAPSVIFSHTERLWSHFWNKRDKIRPRSQSERDAEGYGEESIDPISEVCGKYPEPFSRLFEWYSYTYDTYLE